MYDTKLAQAGFTVVIAQDGEEAYKKIKAHPPDLAVLDINMPELSGFEVIKKLKAENADFDLNKVIVLTNSANPDDRDLAERIGVEYIIKADLTPHEIVNRINLRLGLPLV
jgi:CheY-like chemotaxis protein